ncbi:MAG: hypothetical protein AB8B59_01790 [Maribacter sp.]
MKKILFFILFTIFYSSADAQELFRLELDDYQHVENKDGTIGSQLKFPKGDASVIIGGLNDLDGMNNYFNIFGSKLIIDSLSLNTDGTQKVILRREDGKNFFNVFPKVSATLTPVVHSPDEIIWHNTNNSQEL